MNVLMFKEELIAIKGKYQYSLTRLDYTNILKESIAKLDFALSGKDSDEQKNLKRIFESFLVYSVAILLPRSDFESFVRLLKINNVKCDEIIGKIGKFIPASFLKFRVFICILKERRFNLFLRNQYAFFQKKSVQQFLRFFYNVFSERSLKSFLWLLPGHLRIPAIQVIITTKCTLRCKHCAYLINLCRRQKNGDNEEILETLRKLQRYTDRIDHLIFVGGEPFCNPRLKYYIHEISAEICKNIEIITNGTICPNDPELLNELKEKKAIVTFSNYGIYSSKQDEFIELLKDQGIPYKLYSAAMKWYDFGEPLLRNKKPKELNRQFLKCGCTSVFTVMNGIVDLCPRSLIGSEIGLLDVPKDETVDLLHSGKKAFIKQIKKLSHRSKAITACKYCSYDDNCKTIPKAEQI